MAAITIHRTAKIQTMTIMVAPTAVMGRQGRAAWSTALGSGWETD